MADTLSQNVPDFREKFSKLDPDSTISLVEFGALLHLDHRAMEDLRSRGKLPPSLPIPGAHRAVWSVRTVRIWLHRLEGGQSSRETDLANKEEKQEQQRAPGRPRKIHDVGTDVGTASLKETFKNAMAEIEETATETLDQIFLPGMTEVMRTMPNNIARSSVFAPVARGRRKMHDNSILVSHGDAEIRFSGKQLDEAQADVWMQAIKEAQRQPLGTPVVINRTELLREIGLAAQVENYRWLHRTFQDLVFAMLVVEVTKADGKAKQSVGKTRSLRLISGFDYDEENEQYRLTIDPRWALLNVTQRKGIEALQSSGSTA